MIKLTRYFAFQNENSANKDALVENFCQIQKTNDFLESTMKNVKDKDKYPQHETILKYWQTYLKNEEKEKSPVRTLIQNPKAEVEIES